MSSIIGIYWIDGPRLLHECASVISKFMISVGNKDERLQYWHKTGKNWKDRIRPEVSDISLELRQNISEQDGLPIAEFGYRFSAWNGINSEFRVDISANLGNVSGIGSNNINLRFGDGWRKCVDSLDAVFCESVDVTSPDKAILILDSSDIEQSIPIWCQRGHMIYSREGGIEFGRGKITKSQL